MSLADRHLKSLGEAAAKAARSRKWHWCRRDNGFSDDPKWHVVAARVGLPPYQVIAVVNRLEEVANAAGNIGHGRGYVGHFSPAEFGVALGMPEEQAARIFAALEDPAIGWVAYDHVATFYDRNKDREDETANERKRRQRRREEVLKQLAKLARLGRVTLERRAEIEARLMDLGDVDLSALLVELSRAALSTAPGVTRDGRRDIVTVTPEESREFKAPSVDNFGVTARDEVEGATEEGRAGGNDDPQADAAAWLLSTGAKIVTERMEIAAPLAATKIERWCHQELEGDAAGLAEIIRGADATDYMGARFHNLVVDGVRRRKQHVEGPQLALLPPRPGKARAAG